MKPYCCALQTNDSTPHLFYPHYYKMKPYVCALQTNKLKYTGQDCSLSEICTIYADELPFLIQWLIIEIAVEKQKIKKKIKKGLKHDVKTIFW